MIKEVWKIPERRSPKKVTKLNDMCLCTQDGSLDKGETTQDDNPTLAEHKQEKCGRIVAILAVIAMAVLAIIFSCWAMNEGYQAKKPRASHINGFLRKRI